MWERSAKTIWQREQMHIKWKVKEDEEDRDHGGRPALTETWKVKCGGDWRSTATDRRSWRLLIEDVAREKRGNKKTMVTETHLTRGDMDVERTTTTKCKLQTCLKVHVCQKPATDTAHVHGSILGLEKP